MKDKKQTAEDKLPDAELLYQTVFNQSPDGILIIDTNGNFITFNDAAHRQLGYSREEFEKIHISDIDPDESPEEVRNKIKKIVDIGSAEFEVKHSTKAGEIRDVHVIIQSLPISDRIVLHTIWRDITERKLFEINLKKSIKKAEEERSKSEAIIKAIGERITIRDTNYRIIYQNQIVTDDLGDHVGEFCYKAFHGRDHVCTGCPIELSFKDGQIHREEKSLSTDKGVLYFENTASPIRDSTGKIIAGIELVRNITERKRAEEELIESEKRYHVLFDQSPDGVLLIDTKGKLIDFNEKTHSQLGYSREEFAQLSLHDIDPVESPRDIQDRIEKVQKEGKAEFEVKHRTKTGDVRDIQVITRALMLFGRPIHHSIWRDVTERKRMERFLKESEEKFRTLFESASDALFIIDMEGHILDVNAVGYERLGYTKEELLSMHISKLELSSFAALHPERMTQMKKWGRMTVESAHLRKDGSSMPVEINARMMDLNGKPMIFSVIRDITERKNAEDGLRRSHEQLEILVKERTAELTMMNEQLRNLSVYLQNAREEERMIVARDVHDDLGQSLTAIKLGLAHLRKRLPEDQKPITEQVDYVAKLVESTMQSVKRISAELRPGILDHVGLDSAIEWQAAEFAKRNGIPCTVVFEPEEMYVDRDRSTAIFRIFQETLTNVTRHANASKVEALLKLQAGELLLRVKDNGKGITEQQALDVKSIGLIGMRERVHYWGGSFAIQGIPNKGTSVVVRIPLDKTGEALR